MSKSNSKIEALEESISLILSGKEQWRLIEELIWRRADIFGESTTKLLKTIEKLHDIISKLESESNDRNG